MLCFLLYITGQDDILYLTFNYEIRISYAPAKCNMTDELILKSISFLVITRKEIFYMAEKNKKARHWAIVVYPESAPKDWQSIIQETGCACAISPLHDSDVNESTGEVKKPHWHTIISYGNTTTFNNVKELCEKLNAPIPQAINSVKGAIRYFTHKDNPEKFQYDPKDIKTINGFDIEAYSELTTTEIYEIKHSIIEYVRDRNVMHYIDLVCELYELNYDWFKVCVDNTILFNAIVTSQWKKGERR